MDVFDQLRSEIDRVESFFDQLPPEMKSSVRSAINAAYRALQRNDTSGAGQAINNLRHVQPGQTVHEESDDGITRGQSEEGMGIDNVGTLPGLPNRPPSTDNLGLEPEDETPSEPTEEPAAPPTEPPPTPSQEPEQPPTTPEPPASDPPASPAEPPSPPSAPETPTPPASPEPASPPNEPPEQQQETPSAPQQPEQPAPPERERPPRGGGRERPSDPNEGTTTGDASPGQGRGPDVYAESRGGGSGRGGERSRGFGQPWGGGGGGNANSSSRVDVRIDQQGQTTAPTQTPAPQQPTPTPGAPAPVAEGKSEDLPPPKEAVAPIGAPPAEEGQVLDEQIPEEEGEAGEATENCLPGEWRIVHDPSNGWLVIQHIVSDDVKNELRHEPRGITGQAFEYFGLPTTDNNMEGGNAAMANVSPTLEFLANFDDVAKRLLEMQPQGKRQFTLAGYKDLRRGSSTIEALKKDLGGITFPHIITSSCPVGDYEHQAAGGEKPEAKAPHESAPIMEEPVVESAPLAPEEQVPEEEGPEATPHAASPIVPGRYIIYRGRGTSNIVCYDMTGPKEEGGKEEALNMSEVLPEIVKLPDEAFASERAGQVRKINEDLQNGHLAAPKDRPGELQTTTGATLGYGQNRRATFAQVNVTPEHLTQMSGGTEIAQASIEPSDNRLKRKIKKVSKEHQDINDMLFSSKVRG
jgi:hypothetical protein